MCVLGKKEKKRETEYHSTGACSFKRLLRYEEGGGKRDRWRENCMCVCVYLWGCKLFILFYLVIHTLSPPSLLLLLSSGSVRTITQGESPFSPQGGADGGKRGGSLGQGGTVLVMLTGAHTHSHTHARLHKKVSPININQFGFYAFHYDREIYMRSKQV